jgi:hypothetical protein
MKCGARLCLAAYELPWPFVFAVVAAILNMVKQTLPSAGKERAIDRWDVVLRDSV